MKGKYITTLIHMACISHNRNVKDPISKREQRLLVKVNGTGAKTLKRSVVALEKQEVCTA